MQICPNCQSNQFDGTIFCADCGASLIPTTRSETTMSLTQRGATGELVDKASTIADPAPAAPGPRIILVIMNSGRRITLDIGDDLLIGRKDNARGIFPDVDLGLDGGYDAGVSRRHAILAHSKGLYTVEDLGSANGTFVNAQRLAPETPTQLKSGDELKCGTLLMRVELH
jgi:pSer/pThr/pTyr-binding forkhead associated (FHA) protein